MKRKEEDGGELNGRGMKRKVNEMREGGGR
jgi:hypothetical protein